MKGEQILFVPLQELSGRYAVITDCPSLHCTSCGVAYPAAPLNAFRPSTRRRPHALAPLASPQFRREATAGLGLAGLALFPAIDTEHAKCA
jgi:hypothetical protein